MTRPHPPSLSCFCAFFLNCECSLKAPFSSVGVTIPICVWSVNVRFWSRTCAYLQNLILLLFYELSSAFKLAESTFTTLFMWLQFIVCVQHACNGCLLDFLRQISHFLENGLRTLQTVPNVTTTRHDSGWLPREALTESSRAREVEQNLLRM